MPRNPQSEYSLTMRDFSNEAAVTSLYIPAYNVVTNPNLFTVLIPEYETALAGISGGTKVRTAINFFNTKYAGVLPTDPAFQRENKFLVRYQDNVNFALYNVEIPCADLSAGMIPGTDLLDITSGAGAAYKTKFEALAHSPDGNAVTLLDITFVGRST